MTTKWTFHVVSPLFFLDTYSPLSYRNFHFMSTKYAYFSIYFTFHRLFFSQQNLNPYRSLRSTRIISGPICLISQNGMQMPVVSQNKLQKENLDLTISLQIQPLQGSNSKSTTCPSFLQSFILMTSFSHNSLNNISHLISILLLSYAVLSKKVTPL